MFSSESDNRKSLNTFPLLGLIEALLLFAKARFIVFLRALSRFPIKSNPVKHHPTRSSDSSLLSRASFEYKNSR